MKSMKFLKVNLGKGYSPLTILVAKDFVQYSLNRHSRSGRNATLHDLLVLCLVFSHDYSIMTAMSGQANRFSELSHRIIGCAIEVHRELGPGLLESSYQNCLAREFDLNGIPYQRELSLPVI